ncbi:MAG: ABC transporter ATP-binding protein [Methanobacterium sp.]
MNENILELKNVWKTYMAGETEINALKDFNYSFSEGSFNIITGPSGSGKSTLIRIAGLLEEPSKGNVFIKGTNLTTLKEKEKTSFIKDNIGFIFQNSNLIPSLNVLENIMLSMTSKDTESAKSLLGKVEFNKFKKFPDELSFEEQQRISIARAMINDHSIILADEPTGELHTEDALKIMDLLRDLNKKENLTIFMATNNNSLSRSADNVIEIMDGTNI